MLKIRQLNVKGFESQKQLITDCHMKIRIYRYTRIRKKGHNSRMLLPKLSIFFLY